MNSAGVIYVVVESTVDALQKHVKKDHIHMRLWTRLYGISVAR